MRAATTPCTALAALALLLWPVVVQADPPRRTQPEQQAQAAPAELRQQVQAVPAQLRQPVQALAPARQTPAPTPTVTARPLNATGPLHRATVAKAASSNGSCASPSGPP